MNEVYVDSEHGAVVINDSGVSMDMLLPALVSNREIASLVKWTHDTRGVGTARGRHGNLFERDRYVTPENPYDQMRIAYEAASSDDVVGSVLDSTESLAFGRMAIETQDPDQEDIWNQIAEDLDLDSRMREIWRETFITSNCYVAVWWDRKSYKVRGKSKGSDGVSRQRKKTYDNMLVPVGVSILDPLRVLPVGGFLFNQERLCYIADWTEKDVIDSWLLGGDASGVDPIVQQLVVNKFVPNLRDRKEIGNLGVDPNRLYLMDPTKVYRQTPTRSQYDRFATVRLKSVFEILDLKHLLRQMDRAHLVGGTNFIVLVKKGSKERPGQQAEIDGLQQSMRSLAQVPVLIGDERLSVEIVTPKLDQTLNAEKYAGLDTRISGRLYGMFISTKSRGDDSIKLARVVARGLEDKRDQQRRNFDRYVLAPCYAANAEFTEPAQVRFYPKRIALDFDPALATYLLDLRDRGDLSRDSILSEVDYDEDDEARKREYEAEKYDHIFQSQVPFSAPAGGGPAAANPAQPTPALPSGRVPPQAPGRAGGRQGGNRNGGGAAPGSGQGQAPRSGRPAQPSPRVRAALDHFAEDVSPRLSQRTRAHAAAVAAMRARRRDVEDAVDDALEDQAARFDAERAALVDEAEARHQQELQDIADRHEAELAELHAQYEGDSQ